MNRRVKPAAGQNKGVRMGRNIQRDIRVPAVKTAEARDQPAAGEGRQRGDFEAAAAVGHSRQVLGVPVEALAVSRTRA